ncbi:MAG: glycosyltransferase family 4 protein, partial [Patescibacteria group bacterium]
KAVESGFASYLIYNLVVSLRKDFDHSHLSKEMFRESSNDMQGIAIKRRWLVFEFLNYILNLWSWEKATRDGDIFFVASGSNHCALPFALFNKKFSVWVATTLYEDKINRIKKEPCLRKIRDLLSLPILLYFEHLIFKKANKILALSVYTRDKIIEKYKINPTKIDIVPYSIDINKFYPLDYLQRKNNYLLFTGRLTDERKNISLLLTAFSKVRGNYPDLQLILIGENLNKKLMGLIETLNISNSVKILGRLAQAEELLPYYQNASLFIVPSFQEGLCISALEALACGIPIISTRCGGTEDFIKDGYTGFLVKNNDPEELSRKIIEFLDFGADRKKEFSNNARDYIVNYYSPENIWQKIIECFNL